MNYKLLKFIIINIIFLFVIFSISYRYSLYSRKKRNKPHMSFGKWLSQGNVTTKGIFVSFIFGFIFGFIDNLFLWIGTNELKGFIPGNILIKSAWGNTYSDFIGATAGASIASIVKNYFNYDEDDSVNTPIWVEALSIPIGCVCGMFAGQFLSHYI